MSVDIICKVFPGGLRAVNEPESSKLEGLTGKEVSAKISQPRNLQFHRLYFALLKTTLDMIDEDWTTDQFRAICTVGAGYCSYIEDDGKLIAVPKSISFASMDQISFERLYQDTITFICRRWALDDDFLNQLLEFM